MTSQLKMCASQHYELVNNSLRRRKIMNGKNLLRTIGGFVLAAFLIFGVAVMSNTAVQAQRRGGGFHGGGFHGGGFRGGGFRGREFHGRGFGFRPRIFIGPRFGYGYPYRCYGYPYGYYGYPCRYYGYPY